MFPTTRWTLIVASREGTEARRSALEQLLTLYWRPVYLHYRCKGLDAASAQDAVQGFFLKVIEGDFLSRPDPVKGRFRAYLKAAADHYLTNLHERETAQKRGGGLRFVPLDFDVAERGLASAEAVDDAYGREWALSIMERGLARLKQEYADGKRRGNAETILRFFALEEAPTYADAAAASGMPVPQFKAALHRARVRFREILREEVQDTVQDEADIDHEMSELLRLLRS